MHLLQVLGIVQQEIHHEAWRKCATGDSGNQSGPLASNSLNSQVPKFTLKKPNKVSPRCSESVGISGLLLPSLLNVERRR